MLDMRIWYEDNTVNKNIPYYMGIKCINYGITIGCTLVNLSVEDFTTIFITIFVFQNAGLSWIIEFKKTPGFILRSTLFIG